MAGQPDDVWDRNDRWHLRLPDVPHRTTDDGALEVAMTTAELIAWLRDCLADAWQSGSVEIEVHGEG